MVVLVVVVVVVGWLDCTLAYRHGAAPLLMYERTAMSAAR